MNESESRLGIAMHVLQTWFKQQCNKDWEHSYSVKIETLDNPGWFVTIDLADTDWSEITMPIVLRNGQKNFLNYEVTDKVFKGACGVDNLAELLEAFASLVKVAS